MDADGSHQPEQLPQLLEAVEQGADLAMGSRWVPGGSVVNWPLYRQAISRVGSTYARIMLGVKIKDVTGGFRAFRRTTLEKLNLDSVDSVGYGFQVDLAWRVAKLGLTIVERPITFVERELGASKMSGNIVVEAMINVTRWGLTARWNTLSGKLAARKQAAARHGPARRRTERAGPARLSTCGPGPFVLRAWPPLRPQAGGLGRAAFAAAFAQDREAVFEDLLQFREASGVPAACPSGCGPPFRCC